MLILNIYLFLYRMEDASSLKLAHTIYNKLSFDNTNDKLKHGVLGEGTKEQVREALTQILIGEGIPRERAYAIMQDCYQSLDLSSYGDIQPIGDVGHLLNTIKSKGYLIAVNTSDSRNSIEKTLDHLDVKHLVDMVVCGDDEDILPKPHPSTAHKICNKLQVCPNDVIMVGDSTSDMMLVSNAGLGCGIGRILTTSFSPRVMKCR